MTSTVEKRRAFLINVAFYGVIIAAFYLCFKYLFGVMVPFIVALITAALLHKPVKYITGKTPFKRNLPSIVLVFLLYGVIATAIVFIVIALVNRLKEFLTFLTGYVKDLNGVVELIRDWLLGITAKLPESVSGFLDEKITTLSKDIIENGLSAINLDNLSINWSSIISSGGSAIKSTVTPIATFIVGLIVTIIASVFITIDYDRLKSFFLKQFGDEKRAHITNAVNVAKTTLSKMIIAYAKIMGITFTEVTIGLFVLYWVKIFKIEQPSYIFIIALLTAIVDIIPVLGTGTVLIPWAVVELILGDYAMAVGLLVMYVVVFVIRQVLEPKLVSGQVGLPPFVTIAAMYVGTKTIGILGFFILPFIIVILKEFNQQGILHWLKFDPEPEPALAAAEAKPSGKKGLFRGKKKAPAEKSDENGADDAQNNE